MVEETINGVVGSHGDILYTYSDGSFEGVLQDGVMTGQYAEVGPDGTAVNVEYVKKEPLAAAVPELVATGAEVAA